VSTDEDRALNAYLAEKLEEWLRAGPKRTQAEAARIAKVSGAQLSNLRHESRGAGMKTIKGLSKLFGMSIGQIEEEAAKFASTRPRPALRLVELDARYPNLKEAIAYRQAKALPVTLERIQKIALHWPSDKSTGEWIDEIDRLDRDFRTEQKTGVAASVVVADEDDAPPFGR
jgi:transcriptional regulator with XRE-family HTH domain